MLNRFIILAFEDKNLGRNQIFKKVIIIISSILFKIYSKSLEYCLLSFRGAVKTHKNWGTICF